MGIEGCKNWLNKEKNLILIGLGNIKEDYRPKTAKIQEQEL